MDIGIQPDDNVITAYNDLKNHKNARYLIFKVTDDKKAIALEATGDVNSTFEDFKNLLPKDEPRYCVYDYHHEYKDGRK